MYEIENYLTPDGRDVFDEWFRGLKDRTAKVAVERRLTRIRLGNFGDHRACREGISELRINVGPGYRVYYAISNSTTVILFCGGDKSSQHADIDRACEYWSQCKRRR